MMKKKKEYEAMKLVNGEVGISREPEADVAGKPAMLDDRIMKSKAK